MKQLKNLPIDLLRSFVVVNDQGGISRAAGILSRSQPAVSLQIKRLEQLLDQRLFIRSTQQFDLTDSGQLLMDYARKILELNDKAIEVFSSQTIQGRVRLGLPSEFAATLMPRIVGRFARQYPEVVLQVNSELSVNLRNGFANNHYDLILALHDEVDKASNGYVKKDRLVWVTGGDKNPVSGQVPLIVAPAGCVYRARALKVLETAGIDSKIVYTIPDLGGIEAAIHEGLGVTVLARNTVPGTLRVVNQSKQLPALGEIGISLLYRKQKASPATKKLSSYLRDNLI